MLMGRRKKIDKEKELKEKAFSSISAKSFISVVVILTVLIAVCGILTLIIPQGSFERTETGEIVAGTFALGEVKGIEFWRIITAPFRVFFADGGITIIMISIFLLIMSGVFNLLDKTDGMKVIMSKLVQKFGSKKKLVLCLCILFFMLFGSLFGLFEELVTLLPFMIVFMLSLGFDTMTGLGVCLMAACFGFAAAITNPFSIGIASSFAGINSLSGVWLKLIFFAIVFVMMCWFILVYTKRITLNPEKSFTFEIDKIKKEGLDFKFDANSPRENKMFKVFGIFFIIQFVFLLAVALIRPISGYAIPILSITFLIGGIIAGLLVVEEKKKVFVWMGKGALAMLPAVLLIAMASSVNLIMQESGILDTIMNTVIGFLDGKGVFVTVLLIYLLILILQVFIGSASAKIFLVMPILLPICQVVGISPTLLIFVYCMADGFTDVFLPTNPVLLVGLSMAGISYGKWVKWTWKMQLLVLLLSIATLFFAVQIGY